MVGIACIYLKLKGIYICLRLKAYIVTSRLRAASTHP